MNGDTRNLKPVETIPYMENHKWAIIIGISKYKDKSLDLKYADRDAEEFYKLLLLPVGGGFKEDHIKKLINEEATTAEITKALRSFVKKAGKDDIFMIYFACHGAPEMGRLNSNIIYLLTHDTDPNDISGTALRMDEIDRSLKDYLNAERVVIIADTCHSAAIGGGIGGNGRRSASCNSAKAINVYLKEVSKSRGGVALLTSAETNESSLEGEQWGDGHGVFTHFLLQGMRGDADGHGQPKDGVVTVGELFDYVIDKVRKETNNKQHPLIGSNSFDRNLPMAITGEINVKEHYKLGLGLYELGWMLDDTKRFQAAAEQFREAISLSQMVKTHHSEAELGLGKAQIALGNYEKAIQVLSNLTERDGIKPSSEALFYLGIAHAKGRNYVAAEEVFEMFLTCYPEDKNAAWVREYAEWLNSIKDGGRKYALLIGINNYVPHNFPNLAGCLNDVMFMKKVLTQRYGFEETNVITLLDQDATCRGILSAFESLSQKVTVADTVIVHYSGHSVPETKREDWRIKPDQDVYLIAHDTTYNSGYLSNSISSSELHLRMNAIPAVNKTLILDTHPSSKLIEIAEKGNNYVLLLATDSAEISNELSFQIEEKIVQMGLFTGVLVQKFEESNPETLTYGELLDAAVAKIRVFGFDQTPLLIGDRNRLAFAQEDIYLNIFEFTQRNNYEFMEPEYINKLYSKYRKYTVIQPPLMHCSFRRAFLEKTNYDAAIDALQTALKQSNRNYPEVILTLGKAQVSARYYFEALTTFRQYATFASEEVIASAKRLVERAERLTSGRKHALLIGINDYIDPSVMCVKGAVNDVQSLKEVLLTKFGFQENDIKVLLNEYATRAAIMEAFKQLIEQSREEPALFYFAGNGSYNTDREPTIVSADGRQEQVYDIEIGELAELAANNAPNLVTIVDAGWTYHNKNSKDCRTIPADTRERQTSRNIGVPQKLYQNKLRMGSLSIYTHSIETHGSTSAEKSESKFKATKPGSRGKFFGILTQALVHSLSEVDAGSLTYSQWLESVSKELGSSSPVVLGDNLDELVFDNRTMRDEVLKLVTKIEQEPVFETISLLRRTIEQREQMGDNYPEGRLNLGVAYSAVGEYDKSIKYLGRAVDLCPDHPEAHYQLGRVLFESGPDFVRSVSELEKATKLDHENARAYYYLGQAIRVMVERETLAKAEQALKTYLEKGAPLGHEDEVRKFVKSRMKGAQMGA